MFDGFDERSWQSILKKHDGYTEHPISDEQDLVTGYRNSQVASEEALEN